MPRTNARTAPSTTTISIRGRFPGCSTTSRSVRNRARCRPLRRPARERSFRSGSVGRSATDRHPAPCARRFHGPVPASGSAYGETVGVREGYRKKLRIFAPRIPCYANTRGQGQAPVPLTVALSRHLPPNEVDRGWGPIALPRSACAPRVDGHGWLKDSKSAGDACIRVVYTLWFACTPLILKVGGGHGTPARKCWQRGRPWST